MNTSTNDYIPVSYLNAYVYCPRRFFLEYVRGMFEDNAHTVDGRSSHHVVDLRAATHISRDTFNLKYLREQPTYVA